MAEELIKDFQIVEIIDYSDHNGVAIDGSTYLLGDAWSMKNFGHATVIITAGTMTGTPAVTLKESTSAALAGEQAFSFDTVYINSAYGSQNSYTKTAVTANTFDISATNYSTYIIEIDASDMDAADAYDWLRVDVATDANSNFFGATVILSQPKYRAKAGDMPSAIV